MKILFTSDLHGHEKAYRSFAQTLKDYDLGIIAGDLHEGYLPPEEVKRLLNLTDDDLLNELPPEDITDVAKLFEQSLIAHYTAEALKVRVSQLEMILDTAKKPVFIIRGNHDSAEWKDTEFVKSIHGKKISLNNYNFVGYEYTNFEKTEEQQKLDLIEIEKLMDRRTIFVTHAPPHGIMDESYSPNDDHMKIGSHALKDLVMRRPPVLHLFGHVHGEVGIKGRFINGSYPHLQQFVSIDTTAGKINFIKNAFPVMFSCKCGKKLKASRSGQFKCPQCKNLITVSSSGKVG